MATNRPIVRAARLVLSTALVLIAIGCLPSQKSQDIGKADPQPHVKVGGAGLLADDVQLAALTREELVVRVDDLLGKDRPAAARRLIEDYPDVALEVLSAVDCQQARRATFQTIARVFDEQCVRVDASAGWRAVLQERVEHPERFTAHDTARVRLVTMLHSGRPKDAADLSLPTPSGGAAEVLLKIDADQLTAKALMHADRAAEAVKVLARAARASQVSYPYQAAQLLLVLSDAWRRDGHENEALAAWRDAVELAAALATPPHAVDDPILWEHLSALRPVTTPWPPVVGKQFARRREGGPSKAPITTVAHTSTAPGPSWVNEDLLWSEVGHWRLERGESQAALLAFKRAEAATTDEAGKEHLRLAQARALLQMGQTIPAMDVLVRLALVNSSSISRPALATLGSLKFREGHVQQSLALLQKAVEEDADGKWPGRREAEADLGLAYLTTGDETSGLRWLHTAQQGFASANDRVLLAQCLENEAAYQEHVGKTQEAIALRERKRQLEGE
jgi:tetratricopeptide (TPR) repeat protein